MGYKLVKLVDTYIPIELFDTEYNSMINLQNNKKKGSMLT